MEKISKREQLIRTILNKNEDDSPAERAFLESLSTTELEALAFEDSGSFDDDDL